MKHLLKMMDLSTEEIIEILNLADQLKYELKHGIPHDHLKGKTLGMIFRKASTRTRVSISLAAILFTFQQAICRLAEVSLYRILQEFYHATLTVL